MEKKEIVEILKEIGTFLEFKDENPFKCRAYHNASRIIEGFTTDIKTLIETGEIRKVKGIGESIAEKITELVQTGKLKYYEELKESIPSGLLDILKIQGLGPKRAKVLYEKLDIKNLDELENACNKNLLVKIDGFGEKLQEKIIEGIKLTKKYSERFLFDFALLEAEKIFKNLSKQKEITRIEIAGSLRRKKETIKDIDIVASAFDKYRQKLMDFFTSYSEVENIIAKGDTKSSIKLKSGLNADFRIVNDEEFPFALAYFTGSKEHNIIMRTIAQKKGLKLNEYGLFKGDKFIKCRDEEDIFKHLGLAYIPPELREDFGEFEIAEKGEIPELVEEKDIKGIFHVHSTYSDGTVGLEEMVKSAQKLGYEYVGISEHSKSAGYANGLNEAKLKQWHKEIDKLSKKIKGIKILKGTECDILSDGSLDYDDKILATFDFVIVSVHSNFTMKEEEMTKRIIKAISNKYVTILGHPTGRLLLSREGYSVNLNKIIDACTKYRVAIEINAHPSRLDLDWRMCKYAKEKGVKVSINPDAHNIEGLNVVKYGVGIARKGWLEKKDILNTMNVEEILKYLKR
jgi:DNA polymerase (family 10)